MALTTLSGVNAYKGWTTGADTTRDAKITSLISSISTQFETYCDRKFNSATYTEYYNSEGGPYLYLNQYPITVITSIWNDTDWVWATGTLISGTNYRVADNQGVVFKTYLTKGDQSIKITYTAGYTTIPTDLELACIEEITDEYQTSKSTTGAIKSKTLPDGSVTYGDSGSSASTPPFSATTMDILNKYRNKQIV